MALSDQNCVSMAMGFCVQAESFADFPAIETILTSLSLACLLGDETELNAMADAVSSIRQRVVLRLEVETMSSSQ